ncbi:MAG: hypothetical protein HY043_17765 [Verrucomicrobia bacterium]|nr:hypothetical protein [Verrucomicrobiota bacterium]
MLPFLEVSQPNQAQRQVSLDKIKTPAFTVSEKKQFSRLRVLQGLLWTEWFAHSKLVLAFLMFWLGAVWALPLAVHPGWILSLGFFYAFFAGPAYGGGDVIEGCEEFTFALPATRSERYLARLIIGGGGLVVLTALDLLALGIDLSPILARLYLNTGLLKPLPGLRTGWLYGLILAFPLAVFAISFVLSSVAHSRFLIFTAWFWGGLLAMATLYAGLVCEEFLWSQMNGFISCPLVALASVGVFWLGHRSYCRKEIGPYGARITLPSGWWAWAILWLLGVVLALWLAGALARQLPKFFS